MISLAGRSVLPGAAGAGAIMTATVNEDEVKVVGELQPNKSGSVEVILQPGSYLLICNVPGHYAAGMATTLRVIP